MKVEVKNIEFTLKNEQLKLLPEKAIFWAKEGALILADLHFGKVGHFRKAGIPIPKNVYADNLGKLSHLLITYSVTKLIVIGDMFHSHYNNEMEVFKKWREKYPSLVIQLIVGNHDILKDDVYEQLQIDALKSHAIPPFEFIHDPEDMIETDNYQLFGHVHPGVRLSSGRRMSLTRPCFYFKETYGILPAFSDFSGLHILKPSKKDQIFVVGDERVLEV